MKPVLVAALAIACAVASTPALARKGHSLATSGRGGAAVSDPTTRLAPPLPQAPVENRIPAPLPPPAQAPVINGPPLRSPYGGVMR
jgi:hypothetical protein